MKDRFLITASLPSNSLAFGPMSAVSVFRFGRHIHSTSASKSWWMDCQGWLRLMVRMLILWPLWVKVAESGESTVGYIA